MSQSIRRQDNDSSQTTRQPLSPSTILFMTALDTTWRAFVPTLGGVFLGIGLDTWWHSVPLATIICLTLGTVLSAVLIIRQLINVRKPLQ
jgi:F0F1-type ATP synthase assembly protein I